MKRVPKEAMKLKAAIKQLKTRLGQSERSSHNPAITIIEGHQHRALYLVEILEQILLHLTFREILRAMGVSKLFQQTILGSPTLRQKLWLVDIEDNTSIGTADGIVQRIFMHPLVGGIAAGAEGPRILPGHLANGQSEIWLNIGEPSKDARYNRAAPELYKKMPALSCRPDIPVVIGISYRCCTLFPKDFFDWTDRQRSEPDQWLSLSSMSVYDFYALIRDSMPPRRRSRLGRYDTRKVVRTSCRHHSFWHWRHLNGNGNEPAIVVRVRYHRADQEET